MKKYIVLWFAFASLILPAVASSKVNVVVTLPDYGALIRAIGGEHVNLRVLAHPSEDPHYVDPKPSFIVALHRADLLVANGLDLEIGWLPNLVVQSRNSMLQVGQLGRLDLGRHVPDLLEVPTGAIDRSMGDVHGQGNPHINHDPRRMRAILPLIAQRLTALDPANQTYYETRLALTLQSFDELLTELRTVSYTHLTLPTKRIV